jgi:hypothetical protein
MAEYRLWLRGGASLEIDEESREHLISYFAAEDRGDIHDPPTMMQLTSPQGKQMDVRIKAVDAITFNTA